MNLIAQCPWNTNTSETNKTEKQLFGYKFRNMGSLENIRIESGQSLFEASYTPVPTLSGNRIDSYKAMDDRLTFEGRFINIYALRDRIKNLGLRDEWNVITFYAQNQKFSIPFYARCRNLHGSLVPEKIFFITSVDVAANPGVVGFTTAITVQSQSNIFNVYTSIVPQLICSIDNSIEITLDNDATAVEGVANYIRNLINNNGLGTKGSMLMLFHA